MKNVLLNARLTRTTTLVALSATAVVTLTGLAAASYSGSDSAGTIHTCMTTKVGSVRVVKATTVCKAGETALTWNARGTAGAPGAQGADGRPGPAGAAGARGADGTTASGTAGADGQDGTAGATGPAGADGHDGAAGLAGKDGEPGPAGPQGPAGPAGTAASSSGTTMFGRITNNTDPDCAMTASTGTTTAGGCSMTPLRTLGSLLPSAATVSGFTALFDRTQTSGHIYAITIDASSRATDVLLLCTIPAGSSTCTQDSPITLTGNRLFGLEFDGDRSWTGVNFGYQLTAAS